MVIDAFPVVIPLSYVAGNRCAKVVSRFTRIYASLVDTSCNLVHTDEIISSVVRHSRVYGYTVCQDYREKLTIMFKDRMLRDNIQWEFGIILIFAVTGIGFSDSPHIVGFYTGVDLGSPLHTHSSFSRKEKRTEARWRRNSTEQKFLLCFCADPFSGCAGWVIVDSVMKHRRRYKVTFYLTKFTYVYNALFARMFPFCHHDHSTSHESPHSRRSKFVRPRSRISAIYFDMKQASHRFRWRSRDCMRLDSYRRLPSLQISSYVSFCSRQRFRLRLFFSI